MPLGMFVNPLPSLKVSHLLLFDFPADYRASGTLPNVNIAAPALEQMYGKLGTPAKEQGHPLLREQRAPEQEDPNMPPYQDQIIDIDRKAIIYHTGRLSGTLVKYLANSQYQSIVRFDAHPLTGGAQVKIKDIVSPLTPGASAANVWFYRNPATRDELLYTATVEFDPRRVGLVAGNIYKLVVRWEFRDLGITPNERMPISGFDETVAFEVSEATVNL